MKRGDRIAGRFELRERTAIGGMGEVFQALDTAAERLALAWCVAGALGAAHARGMIHRDIKPSNLFLVQGDLRQTRLLDFGIARFAGQTRMTRTGAILGTPGYMAPEQARGDGRLTPALDIFALGCVLFEVLTGRPAFEGHHMVAILAKILFMDAPRLEAHCPEAPPEFAALVSRMMAKDPAARPRDGVALLAELEGFTGFEALAARQKPSGPVAPPGPPPGSLTQGEQRMVSVVLIGWGQEAASSEHDRTLSSEARLACEKVQPFPAYSWDLIALWMRILRMLGRNEEALGVERTLSSASSASGSPGMASSSCAWPSWKLGRRRGSSRRRGSCCEVPSRGCACA